MIQTELIVGESHRDNRRTLKFFNEFDRSPVKRFYMLENSEKDTLRAWQGHQKEQKWFYVIEGSFKLVLDEPNDWSNPSDSLPYHEFTLNAKHNKIIDIPAGLATGFQSLQKVSKIFVFSDVTLEQSVNDDFRFDKDLWYKW